MSFEGYNEFLCQNGHYHAEGTTWGPSEEPNCTVPGCGKRMAFTRTVDQTNGCSEQDPWTMPGQKADIGFDDLPMKDHHGNPYFVKALKFSPLGTDWHPVPTLEEEIQSLEAELVSTQLEMKMAGPWPQAIIYFQLESKFSRQDYVLETPLWVGPVEKSDLQYEALYHEHQTPLTMFGLPSKFSLERDVLGLGEQIKKLKEQHVTPLS